jgi:hypothetical protein
MKKYLKYSILPFIIMTLGLTGCILDAFDTLTQQFPLSYPISISGTETSIEKTKTCNLNENSFYANNQSKIKQIKIMEMAFRDSTVTPDDLQGNVSITFYKSDGTQIFSTNISSFKFGNYKLSPYKIELTQAEIQFWNNYIGTLSNKQFTVNVKVDNLPAGQKSINAVVELVFEMEYDL